MPEALKTQSWSNARYGAKIYLINGNSTTDEVRTCLHKMCHEPLSIFGRQHTALQCFILSLHCVLICLSGLIEDMLKGIQMLN